jgi:hypothetical protein
MNACVDRALSLNHVYHVTEPIQRRPVMADQQNNSNSDNVTTAGYDRQPAQNDGAKKGQGNEGPTEKPATPGQVAAASKKVDARSTPHDDTPDATPPQHAK